MPVRYLTKQDIWMILEKLLALEQSVPWPSIILYKENESGTETQTDGERERESGAEWKGGG